MSTVAASEPCVDQATALAEARTDLASNRVRLSHLMRALFNVNPALFSVEHGLAPRRAFISNLGLHLPEAGRAQRGAGAGRWYDATAMHAAAHLRHSTHRFERGNLKPIQTVLVGLLEDARVELIAATELPGLRRLWLGFHVAEPAHGHSFAVLMLRLARCLLDPAHEDPHPWVAKGRRLFFESTDGGRDGNLLAPAALRHMASLLGHDIGQMRLPFNHRDHVIEPAYRDDNSSLWLHDDSPPHEARAIADTAPAPLGRPSGGHGDSDPASAGDREAAPASTDNDQRSDPPPRAQHAYREWDRLVGDYRSAWCTVLEGRSPPGDPRSLQACITRHAALMLRLDQAMRAGAWRERLKQLAQRQGDELDIDAAVRSAIDRRAQHAPSEKVHQRFDRRTRDIAALLLLDSSASTGDPRPGGGGTVLDLAREAALLTALALRRAGDRCAIDAFASNGRHEVQYDEALGFGAAVDASSLARLAGLRSRWSTRMGAALRHASTRLAEQTQKQRLLLLITDGEPHDIDIHDRRYLIEDARRAVLEARRRGLRVFCVTLDPAADAYARTIFGAGNYRVLDRIESLPRVMPAMALQLVR